MKKLFKLTETQIKNMLQTIMNEQQHTSNDISHDTNTGHTSTDITHDTNTGHTSTDIQHINENKITKLIIKESQFKKVISNLVVEQNQQTPEQSIVNDIIKATSGPGTNENALYYALIKITPQNFNQVNNELIKKKKLNIEQLLNDEFNPSLADDRKWLDTIASDMKKNSITLFYNQKGIKIAVQQQQQQPSVESSILKNLPCAAQWKNKVEDKKNGRLVLYLTDDKKQYINVYNNNRAGVVMPGVSKTVDIRCNQKGQIELLENNKIMYVVDPKNPSKKTNKPNPNVLAWQKKLNKEMDAKLTEDGIWGPKTQTAYMQYVRKTEPAPTTGKAAEIKGPEVQSIKDLNLSAPENSDLSQTFV